MIWKPQPQTSPVVGESPNASSTEDRRGQRAASPDGRAAGSSSAAQDDLKTESSGVWGGGVWDTQGFGVSNPSTAVSIP